MKHIVVIYAENRSFDNLYGNFPGANGLSTLMDSTGAVTRAWIPQKDRDGKTILPGLPKTWTGVTQRGIDPVVTEAQSDGLPNAPFSIETAFEKTASVTLSTNTITRDLVHRFFQNQMQIANGKNDGFAAWSDAGGLALGHFDYSQSAIYALAREFVLADNFFQGAFGGSYLNHQYLICACAPEYPNALNSPAAKSIAELELDASGGYLPRLRPSDRNPASALDGPPSFENDGNLTPENYFGDGKFYTVNTMQPWYQPSGVPPAPGGDPRYADPDKPNTLPPQTETTIGDLLSEKGITWAWYGGSWNAAIEDGPRAKEKREVIYRADANGISTPAAVDFQAHHQPFNYYAAFDPDAHPRARVEHLKDYNDMLADIEAGSLPSVTFYKPEGVFNQHEGNTNLSNGDERIADLVARLRASPQWQDMVIIITYDENGGVWDHAAPPRADLLGPGTRIPAIIISPWARMGSVDHTQYDTGSVLRLITRIFDLPTLRGLARRDSALVQNHHRPMGDLSGALVFN